MANYNSYNNNPAPRSLSTVDTIKAMTAKGTKYMTRFEEVMGAKAPKFLASVISVTNGNSYLQKAEAVSILSASMVSASLDLEVVPTLGLSAIVPYKGKDGKVYAQFQIMTKGLIQLALRTGQYRILHDGVIYEDEYDGIDILTGEMRYREVKDGYRAHDDFGDTFDDLKKAHIAGFFFHFETINGFQQTAFWDLQRIYNHGARYSQSFQSDLKYNKKSSLWTTNFRAMARKTVIKNTLSQYGVLSTAMQNAIENDNKVYSTEQGEYMDDMASETIGTLSNPDELKNVTPDEPHQFNPDSVREAPPTVQPTHHEMTDEEIAEQEIEEMMARGMM